MFINCDIDRTKRDDVEFILQELIILINHFLFMNSILELGKEKRIVHFILIARWLIY